MHCNPESACPALVSHMKEPTQAQGQRSFLEGLTFTIMANSWPIKTGQGTSQRLYFKSWARYHATVLIQEAHSNGSGNTYDGAPKLLRIFLLFVPISLSALHLSLFPSCIFLFVPFL